MVRRRGLSPRRSSAPGNGRPRLQEVATGRSTHVFGEQPSGLMAFTKGGHLVYAVFASDRKAPTANPATDAERVGPVQHHGRSDRTYKLDGNTLAITYRRLLEPVVDRDGRRRAGSRSWEAG